MKRAIGLLFLLPATAMAQTATPTPGEAAMTPSHGLVCRVDYPEIAVRKRLMGSATLLARVTAEGKTKGIIIAASSGSAILDAATTACAKMWRWKPANDNGKPIDAPIAVSVEWLVETPEWRVSVVLSEPIKLCLSATEAAGHTFAGEPITTVIYTHKDGEVVNAAVNKSSGDAELDQKAVACVSAWHFKPQTEDPNIIVTATTRVEPNGPQNPWSRERSQAALTPMPVTGTDLATFDWRTFGAN